MNLKNILPVRVSEGTLYHITASKKKGGDNYFSEYLLATSYSVSSTS